MTQGGELSFTPFFYGVQITFMRQLNSNKKIIKPSSISRTHVAKASGYKNIAKPTTRTPINNIGEKVAARAKRFIDEKQPYCYGGNNKQLNKNNKSHIEYLESKFSSESNFGHILRNDVTDYGENYKWTMSADSSPYVAIDCAGLTRVCYEEGAGISLAHGANSQHDYAVSQNAEVPMEEARVGDLVWKSGHVGIVGENGLAYEAKGWKWGCTFDRKIATTFKKCFHLTGDDDAGSSTPSTPSTPALLSDTQIRSAIVYNKKNNQSICTKIQELVGVTPDGSFGSETVLAIAEWQAANGLDADGKFGPKSKQAAGFA